MDLQLLNSSLLEANSLLPTVDKEWEICMGKTSISTLEELEELATAQYKFLYEINTIRRERLSKKNINFTTLETRIRSAKVLTTEAEELIYI